MLKLETAALTDVGRKRNVNQDYLGDLLFRSGRPYGPDKLEQRGHLFAVADGMGGYAGGEVASELAITTLFEVYYNGPTTGDIGHDLGEAIRQANFQVHETAATINRNQMGTTLTLVLLKGNKAIFGNVGDSRTYLVRQGLPERVTHDHSLVQEQIDAGVLTPEQAEKSSHKNFITRAIGHRDDVELDLFEREVQPGDVLLLCSDGLHGQVKELEMGTIVATAPNLQQAAQQLVNMANERGGPDNISVMLIRVVEQGEPLPSILNGREAVYNRAPNIYNQATERTPRMAPPESSDLGTSIVNGDRPTTPNPVLPVAGYPKPPKPDTQSTIPMAAPAVRPRPGGPGLLLGLLALLALAAGAVAFVLLSNSTGLTPTPTSTPLSPIPVPSATATATAANITVSNPLPTVTASNSGPNRGLITAGPTATAGSNPREGGSTNLGIPNTPPGGNNIAARPLAKYPFSDNRWRISMLSVYLPRFEAEYLYEFSISTEGTALGTPSFETYALLDRNFATVNLPPVGLGGHSDFRIQVSKQSRAGAANPVTASYLLRFRDDHIEYDSNLELAIKKDGANLLMELTISNL